MTTPVSGSTRFQLIESDVVAANKAHFRAQLLRPDNPWRNRALVAMVVLVLLLSGWVALLGDPSALMKTVGVVAAVILILAAFDRWVMPRMVRRHFRAVVAFSREMQFSWDADGFRLQSERESADLPWSEVAAARQTTGAVLLYRSPQMYHAIPLRALAEGEADAIIAAAVGGGASQRSSRRV